MKTSVFILTFAAAAALFTFAINPPPAEAQQDDEVIEMAVITWAEPADTVEYRCYRWSGFGWGNEPGIDWSDDAARHAGFVAFESCLETYGPYSWDRVGPIYEDGSFALAGGGSGCLPWGYCEDHNGQFTPTPMNATPVGYGA